ncbi:MAG: CGNR zinc finger domain-containing protein [Candidatus Eremiobacteraeota bacterium]|nr:CGNR zinc finger domain-containing protein [Candidatus Eremiobacteraeota bacterium]
MGAVEEQPEQPLCIHFVNTVSKHDGSSTSERFSDLDRFLGWAASARLLTKSELPRWSRWGHAHPGEAARFLATAIHFRQYLYDLLLKSAAAQRVNPTKLTELNKMLATPGLRRTLQLRDDVIAEAWDCGDGLMALLRKIALSAADVLLDDSWRMIISCARRDDCDWLAIDTSRNHSRRYCTSSGCGNLARVTRHYRRVRTASSKTRRNSAA